MADVLEQILTPGAGLAAALGFLVGTFTRTAWSTTHLSGGTHHGPTDAH